MAFADVERLQTATAGSECRQTAIGDRTAAADVEVSQPWAMDAEGRQSAVAHRWTAGNADVTQRRPGGSGDGLDAAVAYQRAFGDADGAQPEPGNRILTRMAREAPQSDVGDERTPADVDANENRTRESYQFQSRVVDAAAVGQVEVTDAKRLPVGRRRRSPGWTTSSGSRRSTVHAVVVDFRSETDARHPVTS